MLGPIKKYTSQPQELHHHWHRHLERKYAISNLFPMIKRLAGVDGNVLEIGCEKYNRYDARVAEVSPSRWFFVDPHYRGLNATESGTEIVNPLGFSGIGPDYSRKFRVIYDNVIQFYTNSTTKGFYSEIRRDEQFDTHVRRYTEVIEIGGHLILKLDGWNKSIFNFLIYV